MVSKTVLKTVLKMVSKKVLEVMLEMMLELCWIPVLGAGYLVSTLHIVYIISSIDDFRVYEVSCLILPSFKSVSLRLVIFYLGM